VINADTIAIVVATASKAKTRKVFAVPVVNTKTNGQIQQIFLMENRMAEIKNYCDNCGHESHCAGPLHRDEKEMLLGQIVHEWCIEVCRSCYCKECHA
jgi:tRNA G26 N,N-dimethylase Trm1